MTDELSPEVQAPVATPETETKKRQMSFTVLESGEIRADFGEGVEPLTLNPASVPESLHAVAIAEGFISRLRGHTSKLTADDRTPENLRSAVEKGIAALLAGTWKIERTGGAGVEYSQEVEAAWLFRQMRAKSKGEKDTSTFAEAAENFAKLTDEQVKQLKALPRYQVAFQEVKAKRAAEKLAKLTAKLDADGEDVGF